jgi:chitinase
VLGTNNGLYQPNSGPSQGTWAKDGVYGYQDLVSNYLPGYTRGFQNEAQAPWLYNPKTQIFITYEDPQSLGARADYASANHLGGMMIWELSFDDAQHSLLRAIYKKIHP